MGKKGQFSTGIFNLQASILKSGICDCNDRRSHAPKCVINLEKNLQIQNNRRHKDSKPILTSGSLKVVSEIKYKISLTNLIELSYF